MKLNVLPMFLSGSQGKLFTLYYYASNSDSVSEKTVVFFPPFAEELNKSRRMIALQSKNLVKLGYDVQVIDLFGTGDSEGDFSDARWDIWLKDIEIGINWLIEKGAKRFVFWGLRMGAMLAMQSARQLNIQVDRILFWQPVLSGRVSMNQFLRLRMAADLVSVGDKKVTTKDLRESIERNENIEIAGYTLSPDLVKAIDNLELKDMEYDGMPYIGWFEVAPGDKPLGHASRKVVDDWTTKQHVISAHMEEGEPFWVTPEITVSTGLLNRTTKFLSSAIRPI